MGNAHPFSIKAILERDILLVFFAIFSLFTYPSFVSAQSSSASAFSCNPISIPVTKDTFNIKRGEPIRFICIVTNSSVKPLSASVSGELKRITATHPVNVAITNTTETVKPLGESGLSLEFPAVFEGGMYKFSFFLKDINTTSDLVKGPVYTGFLNNQPVKIISAELIKSKYFWTDKFTLDMSVLREENFSGKLVFDAVILSREYQECAEIAKNQLLLSDNVEYKFTLPKRDICDGREMVITLKKENGELVDKATAPISAYGQTASFLTPENIRYTAYVILVAILLVIGYLVVRSKENAGVEEKK